MPLTRFLPTHSLRIAAVVLPAVFLLGFAYSMVPFDLGLITSHSDSRAQALMAGIEEERDERAQITLMRELAQKAGPEKALALLNASNLRKSGQTHLLSHAIGEVAYLLYGDRALPVCADDTLNGCVHGLMLTAIPEVGMEGVKRMIAHCETLAPFKYHMCLHASGHALLAVNDYKDLPGALAGCDTLMNPVNPLRTHCYNGVFMENAHGEHNGILPFLHPWLSTHNLLRPCDEVAEQYRSACYLNQAGWWYLVLSGDIDKVAMKCATIPAAYRLECANNVGRVISTAVKNDLGQVKKYCAYFNGPPHDECINAVGQSVFALGDEELPFTICRTILTPEGKKACYEQLVNAFQTNAVSDTKIKEYCLQFEDAYHYLCPNP